MRSKYNTYLLCKDDGDSLKLTQAPLNWDDVKFNLIRDLVYLGIMKQISVEYEFVGEGFRFLQSKRLKLGIDADIMIRVYINNPNTFLFEGKINQENYQEDRKFRKYKVDIVQSSFVQNFQNREDIIINILNNISLDRKSITPAPLVNCLFRGKQIEFFSEFEGSSLVTPEIYHHILPFRLKVNGNPGVKEVSNIYPDTWIADTLIIEDCRNNPLILVDNAFYSNVLSESQTIGLAVDFNFTAVYLGMTLTPSDNEKNFVVLRLLKVNADNTVDEQLFYEIISVRSGSVSLTYSFNDSVTCQPGQYLIWLLERWGNDLPVGFITPLPISMMDTSLRTEITYNSMSITIDQDSIVSDTTHPVILPHELFSNIVAQINGGSLYSEVFGRIDLGYYADGEFAYLGITKGELLRGIDPTTVQIPTSMREAFQSYSSVICLGAIITETQIRIDPLELLFNSNISTNLGEVNELVISPAKEFIFNSVKAGYPKNEYEQENGRDEYNTEYQYTNSFKSVKKELNLVSKYYGDGYGIEFARRASIVTTGTADSRYDDLIFLVDMIKVEGDLFTPFVLGPLSTWGISNTSAQAWFWTGGIANPFLTVPAGIIAGNSDWFAQPSTPFEADRTYKYAYQFTAFSDVSDTVEIKIIIGDLFFTVLDQKIETLTAIPAGQSVVGTFEFVAPAGALRMAVVVNYPSGAANDGMIVIDAFDDQTETISNVGLMTRRLEGILEVSGIFSPETALNLRIAVGQNMLRWKKYLNIPLHKKDHTYFFQSKDKNSSLHLVTDLGVTDDGEDLATGAAALFLPDQRGFKCPITIEKLFEILANPLGLVQYRYKKEDFFDYLMEVDAETDKNIGTWRMLGTRDTPVEIESSEDGNLLMHDSGLTDYVAHEDAEDDLVLYE